MPKLEDYMSTDSGMQAVADHDRSEKHAAAMLAIHDKLLAAVEAAYEDGTLHQLDPKVLELLVLIDLGKKLDLVSDRLVEVTTAVETYS